VAGLRAGGAGPATLASKTQTPGNNPVTVVNKLPAGAGGVPTSVGVLLGAPNDLPAGGNKLLAVGIKLLTLGNDLLPGVRGSAVGGTGTAAARPRYELKRRATSTTSNTSN
jgi:hypothetical protein